MERTDTRTIAGIEPGEYTLVVASIPLSGDWGPGKNYYEWDLIIESGGERIRHTERTPVWMCGPLLRALGCREVEKDVFEWEKADVVGTAFNAEIFMEPERKPKDPANPKSYRRMRYPVAIPGHPKRDYIVGDTVPKEEVPF